MKISPFLLLLTDASDRFIERGPANYRECLEHVSDITANRPEADGVVNCFKNQCFLKCKTTNGYQPYGGLAKVKCIKTKKGYKWNKPIGTCRTCRPLQHREDQLYSKCKTNGKGIKTCTFKCKKGQPSNNIYPMERPTVMTQVQYQR